MPLKIWFYAPKNRELWAQYCFKGSSSFFQIVYFFISNNFINHLLHFTTLMILSIMIDLSNLFYQNLLTISFLSNMSSF